MGSKRKARRGEIIQNIRKRARMLRLSSHDEEGEALAGEDNLSTDNLARPLPQLDTEPVGAELPHPVEGDKPRSAPKKGFHLKPEQKMKEVELKKSMRLAFEVVYAKATADWASMVASGANGKGDKSADAVAARWRKELPEGCTYVLTGHTRLRHKEQAEGTAARRAPHQTAPGCTHVVLPLVRAPVRFRMVSCKLVPLRTDKVTISLVSIEQCFTHGRT
mmetsp:Transcript_5457/g.12036  ORF Transcript_5457/g.12036 Transcript_5457/m.12036 type:complete len:220 (-) Transcript_5457:64-723(-)|eukprot:CAMPEP_0183334870 /NCGR_PEP_ID=MMETSP0164_2-20130417/3342_1 /TAXON_ID=221442 /ORGANISM="Coccolithus pelagicus ssp braarudi, Strain PLY182g" /LENGTH=219 /DNA_ID=CAMNT_0025504101 /DNA_START=147 /DNA_END=806 /DNA_ORIENTATION=-